MPGGIESNTTGQTSCKSAKRHFDRLSAIGRSDKPYAFLDFFPCAISEGVVARWTIDALITHREGCDVDGASSRMPLPDTPGFQPEAHGVFLYGFAKVLKFVEVHAVDDGLH